MSYDQPREGDLKFRDLRLIDFWGETVPFDQYLSKSRPANCCLITDGHPLKT